MIKKLKHFYESQQLDNDLISHFFKEADEISEDGYQEDLLKGEILATLFYEPNIKTRRGFQSAIYKFGGEVIVIENPEELREETIEDTIRVTENDADCIVIRNYDKEAIKRAVDIARVPIINAGDWKEHPTQALIDLYTINSEIGRVKDLNIALVGDLANGRKVRSLCYLLAKYPNNKLTFVFPENLKLKEDISEHLKEHKTEFTIENDLNKVLPSSDVVYMAGTQQRVSKYIINESNFNLLRRESRILHPLPRVDEIQLPLHIEKYDPRFACFRQSENGLYIRMALLKHFMAD